MENEKPVRILKPVDIDFAGYHPSDDGIAIIGFVTDGTEDVDLHMTPEVLLKLETKLGEIREKMAARRPLQ